MQRIDIEKRVRARLWQELSPHVAGSIGLSLEQLQQAAIGCRHLTPWQYTILARWMKIKEA
jgi:hypothetical protein